MATGRNIVDTAMTQQGDPYVFGAEVSLNDPNPRRFDCSELIEWACARNGVRFIDGSANQIAKCRGISLSEAINTPGAVLWFPGHIAISRGNGTTIEARGRKYGVNVFSAHGRFKKGGLIPGVNYAHDPKPIGQPAQPGPPPTPNVLQILAWGIAVAKTKVLDYNRPPHDSDAVKFAQAGINRISGRGLVVDGVFGPSTWGAVVDLQRWFGLTVDGIIGPQTWRILYP